MSTLSWVLVLLVVVFLAVWGYKMGFPAVMRMILFPKDEDQDFENLEEEKR